MNSRTILKMLRKDGWEVVTIRGSHHQLKHPTKPGKVTIQHPKKEIGITNIISIEHQSGLKLR